MHPLIKVSFIIPVHNAAAYLERCLHSLLCDTSPSVEVIAIDDGSTDESLAILRHFAAEDGRVHVITQQNAGTGPARNAGLDEARGSFVVFIDADDHLLDDAVSFILQAISTYQFDVCVFAWTTSDPRWQPPQWRGGVVHITAGELTDFQVLLPPLYTAKLVFSSWNKIYRRAFLMETHLRFDARPIGEDADFNCRVFSALPSLLVLPCVLYFYNHNQKSAIHLPNQDKAALQVTAFDEWESLFARTGSDLHPIRHNDLVFGMISLSEMAGNPKLAPQLRKSFLESGYRRRYSRIRMRDLTSPRDIIAWLILRIYFAFHQE